MDELILAYITVHETVSLRQDTVYACWIESLFDGMTVVWIILIKTTMVRDFPRPILGQNIGPYSQSKNEVFPKFEIKIPKLFFFF